MYLQHHCGNPKGDPERANEGATHDTRGKADFQKKARVYLRGIEKGWERDAEEREKRSRGMLGEEAVAMNASDSEGWSFWD